MESEVRVEVIVWGGWGYANKAANIRVALRSQLGLNEE